MLLLLVLSSRAHCYKFLRRVYINNPVCSGAILDFPDLWHADLQKINQLLHQIAQMNQLLLALRRDSLPGTGGVSK